MATAKSKSTNSTAKKYKRKTVRNVLTGEEREVHPESPFGEEHTRKLDAIYAELDLLDRKADLTRARSYTVGSAFGGTTEISMRSPAATVHALLQPVETIELIHQLAANVGCHIHIMPRQDFSSWRGWEMSKEELEHYRGINPPGVGHPAHLSQESAKRLEDGIGVGGDKEDLAIGTMQESRAIAGSISKVKKS